MCGARNSMRAKSLTDQMREDVGWKVTQTETRQRQTETRQRQTKTR